MKQKLMKSLEIVMSGILIFSLTGCASIIDGGDKHVSVRSEPTDAKVTVYDKRGVAVVVQQTPAIIALKTGDGYFKGASYRLEVEKPGYQKGEINITATVNGWYFGNFIFGGLLGLLIIDPITGAMYTLSPKDAEVVLQQDHASIQKDQQGLVVILRKDVPVELASRLVPVANQ